jgi:hypothetical protein
VPRQGDANFHQLREQEHFLVNQGSEIAPQRRCGRRVKTEGNELADRMAMLGAQRKEKELRLSQGKIDIPMLLKMRAGFIKKALGRTTPLFYD